MNFSRAVARVLARVAYYGTRKVVPTVYAQDGLMSAHAHDFVNEVAFTSAYQRGLQSIGGIDTYHWHWRVHVGLWAATAASKLTGDFVECGVNKGFMSSAIMEYLDWDSLGKTFFLLDTFSGLDPRYMAPDELARGSLETNATRVKSGYYTSTAEDVKANFRQWKNICVIEGSVPDTLNLVVSDAIAYLHLDMNCAPPEVAAIDFFWNRLVPGALVLLDDYAYVGYHAQKAAMDTFAGSKGVQICSLPTGQGLLLRPPHELRA